MEKGFSIVVPVPVVVNTSENVAKECASSDPEDAESVMKGRAVDDVDLDYSRLDGK